MDYSFNAAVAVKYGVEEAVLIHNLYWWISKNKANNKHFYDGRYWTYNSRKAFAELFPFWTNKQMRRICNSIEKQGAAIVGNYNKNQMDRTLWYALSDIVLSLYGEQDDRGTATVNEKQNTLDIAKNNVEQVDINTNKNTICLNGQMQLPNQANASDQMDNCKCLDGQMQVTKQANDTDINTNINTNKNLNINSYITPLPPNLTKAQQSLLGEVIRFEEISTKMKFELFKWIAYKNYNYNAVSIQELLTRVRDYVAEYGEERVIDVIGISMSNVYSGIVWNLLQKKTTRTNQEVRKRTYEEEYC